MSEERLEANDKVVEAKDGYVNLPASLGEASPLQSSGDYVRSNISRNYELLTVLYRENWIAKRIIDMPCEDATREWYTLSTELNQNLIDKIKKVEAKHNVKGELTNAMRWARLYGGSLALMVIKGQEDMLEEPLDFDMIMPGSFKGLLVLDMVTGITPSIELEDDMDDPDFGLPKWYDVVIDSYDGEMVRIHHSRVLRFIGRDLPPQEEIIENYWGASELEHIYEELQKRNATSANIAQLVFQANTRVLKMADYGEVIGMGTNKQKKEVLAAIEAQNRLLTSFGVQIMGTEDNMESHPYSFSGISEVYESFMMDMAGAANIPATKLFGRSPQGMNATGESDMNNYYEAIAQMQERQLRPALEKLLPVICMSIFGAIPNDMEIVFEPIATTTPEQRASIASQFTGTIIEAFSGGLIGRKTALMELKEMGKDIGVWTKISDETIEEADDEVDNGEMGMGEMPPDGGDMPMMPEGQGGVEMPSEQPQPPVEGGMGESQVAVEKPSEQPKLPVESGGENSTESRKEPSDEDIVKQILEEGKDGGPGSGNFNHPGYRRGQHKASIAERVGFIANPTANIPESRQQMRTKASVEKANREREDWSNLTTHQKVQGNAEQERHMRKVKGEVYKAAMKGDMEKAKALVRKNKHYFMNDPDSVMKVQSETLKRQKKVKPSGFIGDAIRKIFRKDGGEGSGNFNHKGVLGQRGGSAPSGEGGGSSAEGSSEEEPFDFFSWLEQEEKKSPEEKEREDREYKERKAKEEREERERKDFGQNGLLESEYPERLRLTKEEQEAIFDVYHSYADPNHKAKPGVAVYNALSGFPEEAIEKQRKAQEERLAEAEKMISERKEQGYSYANTGMQGMSKKQKMALWNESVAEAGHGVLVGEQGIKYWQSQRKQAKENLKWIDMAKKIAKRNEFAQKSENYVPWRKNQNNGNAWYKPWEGHDVAKDEGGGNPNHDPESGRFTSGSGSSGGRHPSKDEIQKAVKNVISGGFKKGIDRKGMDRHRDKGHAEKAAEEQYQRDLKRYKKAIENGREAKEPVKMPKSYFNGVSPEFILQKAMDAIDKGKCKWYSKAGGEQKAQVTFNKDLGFTVQRGSDVMVPTRTVTITYSRENGFHCYPDEKRE